MLTYLAPSYLIAAVSFHHQRLDLYLNNLEVFIFWPFNFEVEGFLNQCFKTAQHCAQVIELWIFKWKKKLYLHVHLKLFVQSFS